jgi:hypothetical protein
MTNKQSAQAAVGATASGARSGAAGIGQRERGRRCARAAQRATRGA